jgi:CYTH domain-containing protein
MSEIYQSGEHPEIERKFLIAFPDEGKLAAMDGCRVYEIEQIYLPTPKGISERVRRVDDGKKTTYIHTVKKKLSALTRSEFEEEISAEVYERMSCSCDERISKRRYRIPYGGRLLEIDIFPFWRTRAFCEVELESEDEDVVLPDFIKVIEDVSEDNRYSNHSLARELAKNAVGEDY